MGDKAPPQSMRNDDFRKFLSTPRAQLNTTNQKQQHKPKDNKGKHNRRPFKPSGGRGARNQVEDEEDTGPQYRDRAAERRKGINPDYDDTELTALSGHATANLTVEETKFLGGDFEHTHLVKGLDFQLLNRVRQQIDVRAPGEHGVHTDAAGGLRDTGVHDARAPTKHTSPGPANATTMMPPPPPSHGGRHAAPVIDVRTAAPTPAMSFASALGRRVYDTIFRPPRVDVAELYLPRRTAFVYEMDSGNDIPTTLRRSRADCPKVEETMIATLHEQLMQRIAKIMMYVGPSGKRKKKERGDRGAPSAAGAAGGGAAGGEKGGVLALGVGTQNGHASTSTAVGVGGGVDGQVGMGGKGMVEEDEGDIFEDVGVDYVPTVPKKKDKDATQPCTPAAVLGNVFDTFAAPPPAATAAGGVHDVVPDTQALLHDVQEEEEEGDIAGPSLPPGDMDPDAAYGAYPEPEEMQGEEKPEVADEEPEPEEALEAPAGYTRRPPNTTTSTLPSNLAVGDEAYAECYPDYYDMGTAVVDSDEEEGVGAKGDETMDRVQEKAAQNKQLKSKAKQHDNKINTDLDKIQGMLSDKYGGKHDTAFRKKEKRGEDEGAADAAPIAQRAKRLRL